jgi:hypothetical protein
MLVACYGEGVAALQVKNVPPELHEALRQRAAEEGVDLQVYVLQALQRDLATPTRRSWLRRLSTQPVTRGLPPATEILDDVRADRH